jgi:hypothetical protein
MSAMDPPQRHGTVAYYALTDGIDVAALEDEWVSVLSTDEAAKLRTLLLERDRRDYLAAHVLLRQALAAERDIDPTTATPGERSGWSLTHADGLVACAVATNPNSAIGIDSEPIAAAERLAEFVDTFVTPAELAALPSDPEARDARMVEIWTAKESVLKALGEGFSGRDGFGVLSRLETAHLGMLDEWATISVRDARSGAAYSVWGRWVGIHAIAIVATEGNEGTPRLTGVSIQ